MSLFEKKILELENMIARLKERQKNGWRYQKVWFKPTTVKQHRRAGYYAMMPVKKR